MDKADKEKLKKLRAKVANMQRELDIASRRPKGPPKPSYGGQSRNNDWSKLSGEEKQAMTCRDYAWVLQGGE